MELFDPSTGSWCAGPPLLQVTTNHTQTSIKLWFLVLTWSAPSCMLDTLVGSPSLLFGLPVRLRFTPQQGMSFAAAARVGRHIYAVGSSPFSSTVARLSLDALRAAATAAASPLAPLSSSSSWQQLQQQPDAASALISGWLDLDGSGGSPGGGGSSGGGPTWMTSMAAAAAAPPGSSWLGGGSGTMGWEAIEPLPCPRLHCSVVGYDAGVRGLVVLGGRSQGGAGGGSSGGGGGGMGGGGGGGGVGVGAAGGDRVQHVLRSVDMWDPDAGSWSRLPDMTHPRSALAAAQLAGRLYVLGGQGGKGTHRSVEWLDVGAAGDSRWCPLRVDMTAERKYAAAAALGGRLLVCGGMSESRCRLASVEALDPREPGPPRVLPPMSAARSSAGCAVLGGKLYLVGGASGDSGLLDSVEVYVPEMNSWLPAAPISGPRSGLGLCSF